jgi:hypothetical protein
LYQPYTHICHHTGQTIPFTVLHRPFIEEGQWPNSSSDSTVSVTGRLFPYLLSTIQPSFSSRSLVDASN